MKLLIIDDDAAEQKRFQDAIELWNISHKNNPADLFDLDCIEEFEQAQRKIESPGLEEYDGVVVDMRFKKEIKGDELLNAINQRFLRVPIVIYTGTPDSVEVVKGFCLKVCIKTVVSEDKILEWFFDVKMSGLMAVVGMQGGIEKKLREVFCQFQVQSLERWAKLGKQRGVEVAERSAMRYVLTHLLDSLYQEDGAVFPDEMYLNVGKSQVLKTGDVIMTKGGSETEYYLVMSPACDLVVRKTGTPKTESVLLVGIVSTAEATARSLSDKIVQWKNQGADEDTCKRNEESYLKRFREQTDPEYVHSVPCIKDMPRQYVAFRKVLHLPYEKVDKEFSRSGLRIAPPFLKDIQARFASYYGRQGQPDVDYSLEYGTN